MLSRYTMYRGPRPADDPMPEGIRVDTRRHTRHCLRPPRALVDAYLDDPTPTAWRRFERGYLKALAERARAQPDPFDALAAQAGAADVFIGCSCPTRKNPDLRHCHTVLALGFMKKRYPGLRVVIPKRP